MRFLNILKKLVITSQAYVALCATLLGCFVLLEQEAYQNSTAVILFFTFWNGYAFTIFKKKKMVLLTGVLSFFLISLLHSLYPETPSYSKWLVLTGLGLLYNARFRGIKVREIYLLKTFYVGAVWAASLVFYPLADFHPLWFLCLFFFVAGITFPFEIRDLSRDRFPTLPTVLGIANTRYLSVLFLLLSAFCALLFLESAFLWAWLATLGISMFMTYFSDPQRPDRYYSFYMESLSAMPFLIYFILTLGSH